MDQTAPLRKDARLRLLDAASTLIRRQGYAATSLEELCRAAGVTKGAFFHYFRSKEDLGVAAAARFCALAEGLFDAPWSALPTPAARVLGYVALRREIVAGGFEDFTCLLGALAQETYATSPALRGACEAGIAGHALRLVPDLADALAQAGRRDVDASKLALYIQAAIQGGFVLAKATGDPQTARDVLDHLARYLRQLFRQED